MAIAVSISACSKSASRETRESAKKAGVEKAGIAKAEPEALSFNRDTRPFNAELARIDLELERVEARAEVQVGSWLVLEKAATLYMARARLSGSFDDYAAAQARLDRAFARAPEGSGPLLTRAALNFTLHRLDRVEADLDRVEGRLVLNDPTRARIEGLRGALAFERGDYPGAKRHWDASRALHESPGVLSQLARWHWRRGDFETAEALYVEAGAAQPDGALEARAWTALQIGILDLERGRYAEALDHYRDGAMILGGWWLLEEHIAEVGAQLGHRGEALALYAAIITATGKAEFMDARAALLLEAGEGDRPGPSRTEQRTAAALIERATGIYALELERFPEASYGHALGHFQHFGPPDRALELATANHALRPGVLAKISLAEARLEVGDAAGAREVIDEALATTWRSAKLFEVGAEVYGVLAEDAQADELRAAARALCPQRPQSE